MNWSAGSVASWLIPYRMPSPTSVEGPRLEARSTLSASLVAAWLSPAAVSGTAAARIMPMAIVARANLLFCRIDVSGGESTTGIQTAGIAGRAGGSTRGGRTGSGGGRRSGAVAQGDGRGEQQMPG